MLLYRLLLVIVTVLVVVTMFLLLVVVILVVVIVMVVLSFPMNEWQIGRQALAERKYATQRIQRESTPHNTYIDSSSNIL